MNNETYIKQNFKETLVNINGEIFSPDQAKISVFDRSFLYGDSIYEVTRSYNGKLFALDEHLERLWLSADYLSLKLTITKDELKKEIEKTFKTLNLPNCYLRIIISRGVGEIGLDTKKVNTNNVVLILKSFKTNPIEWYEQGVHYIVAQTKRNPKDALNPRAKTGNYLNSILAFIEAKNVGAFDAVMLDHQGLVTEGTTNNLWMVKNNQIYTPSLERSLLKGITRDMIFQVAKLHQLSIQEKDFDLKELLSADEVFMTSSLKEVVPIVKIDEQMIGSGKPGTLTKKLHQHYLNYVKQQTQN